MLPVMKNIYHCLIWGFFYVFKVPEVLWNSSDLIANPTGSFVTFSWRVYLIFPDYNTTHILFFFSFEIFQEVFRSCFGNLSVISLLDMSHVTFVFVAFFL